MHKDKNLCTFFVVFSENLRTFEHKKQNLMNLLGTATVPT